MRRLFSLSAGRALFGSAPRTLTVVGVLAAYSLVALWVAPFVPSWVVTVAGLLVLAGLIWLGSVWLDGDIMRTSAKDSPPES